MKDSSIKNEYLKKIKLLHKYNKAYFDESKSLITDQEFDILKKQIFELEKKYSFLKHKNSPSKTLGFKPSKNFKKIKHRVPMLSLANAFNEEDLINFEKKIILIQKMVLILDLYFTKTKKFLHHFINLAS